MSKDFVRRSFHFGLPLLSLSIFIFFRRCVIGRFRPSRRSCEKMVFARVPNAGKINDFLFRGGQHSTQGLAHHKQQGVTAIVKLPGWGREVASERKQAESLGLRFTMIPVGGWSSLSDERIIQFLALFRDTFGQKIFVHCQLGEDRNGVLVAANSITDNYWQAQQAIKEMHCFGFHNHWHPDM